MWFNGPHLYNPPICSWIDNQLDHLLGGIKVKNSKDFG